MRRLALFSGKGGTGKTSLTAAFTRLAGEVVAVDCDVDAANLALLLPGADAPSTDFLSGERAVVDPDLCISCGRCLGVCRFDALGFDARGLVVSDPLKCEGCHACTYTCPTEALYMRDNLAGTWAIRRLKRGWLVHATLGVAQDNSGKLVARVRQKADALARAQGLDTVLIDGPPGIGCPVHAAMGQVHRILAVTEPTPSGEHDLVRLLDTAAHFGVPAMVAINKHDLAPDQTEHIEALCAERGVEVAGRVPFDPMVPRALARGELPLGEVVSPATDAAIRHLYDQLTRESP